MASKGNYRIMLIYPEPLMLFTSLGNTTLLAIVLGERTMHVRMKYRQH